VAESHEPSYYEIALTNRQVIVAFVLLLTCILGAFFSGVWIGREATARAAQDQIVRNAPPPQGPQDGRNLDELLSERDKLNARLQEIIDAHTVPFGVKVSTVEVKDIDLPQEMQRAMARQAEAEREKRGKIIHAEGEMQASAKLAEAADIISVNPVALQLRYLQTLTEIASEKNSTIIFPLPIEMMKAFFNKSS